MKQLILGGARSGKSQFAENLALEIHTKNLQINPAAKLYYIATSPHIDAEMNARIEAHKARRTDIWQTIEAPLEIAGSLQNMHQDATILIDCLTLWINNLMFENLDLQAKSDQLLATINNSNAHIILVSNELGMGLVPEAKLSREFRDYQGKLNQLMAQKVDKVAFVVAGLPLWMK